MLSAKDIWAPLYLIRLVENLSGSAIEKSSYDQLIWQFAFNQYSN